MPRSSCSSRLACPDSLNVHLSEGFRSVRGKRFHNRDFGLSERFLYAGWTLRQDRRTCGIGRGRQEIEILVDACEGQIGVPLRNVDELSIKIILYTPRPS